MSSLPVRTDSFLGAQREWLVTVGPGSGQRVRCSAFSTTVRWPRGASSSAVSFG
jgi:hypothetical protein